MNWNIRSAFITLLFLAFYFYLFYLYMEWNQMMDVSPNDVLLNLMPLVNNNIVSIDWILANTDTIKKFILPSYVDFGYSVFKFWILYYQIKYF